MTYSITEAAPLEFYTSKRGKEGWPVVAHQIAMNSHYKTPPLVLDGVFGPATEKVAKEVQAASHVAVDGVVGPETQEAFTRAKCKHAEKGNTPPGLLIGVDNIESSYQWACVSILNENETHDYGTTQESLKNPHEAELEHAFNPDAANHTLAGELIGFHNAYQSKAGSKRAWELSTLNHNWPVAAIALATNKGAWLSTYSAEWLTKRGYKTGLEYCEHYIKVATAQVTSWTVV